MAETTLKIECEDAVRELDGIVRRLEAVCDRLDVHRSEGRACSVTINTNGIVDQSLGKQLADAVARVREAQVTQPRSEAEHVMNVDRAIQLGKEGDDGEDK